MSHFLAAFRGELRAIARDRSAAILLGIGAIAYGFLYPLPYLHGPVREIPVVVVDQDRSALSRQLTRMVDATEQVHVVAVLATQAEGEVAVRRGEASGVVVIPAELERRVLRGERAVVGVLADASYFLVYSQVGTGVSQAVGTLSAGVEIRRLEALGAGGAAAQKLRDPLPLELHPLYNPSGSYGRAVVPAVLILILQQTLLIGIATLAGGRRERGEDRGHAGVAALVGRATAYVGIYLVHAAFYLSIVYRLYGLPRTGSVATAMVFLLPFFMAATFLGVAVGQLFREGETALQALIFTSMVAIFLSGATWPIEAIPAWLRPLSRLLPSTEAIPGAVGILQMNASLSEVGDAWLGLWALAAAYFALAWANMPSSCGGS